ncbi:lantibiotic dehydratase [Actinomycetota bacterium Odt1-20B]
MSADPAPSRGARAAGPFEAVHAALLRSPLRPLEPPRWLTAATSPVELLEGAASDALFMDALRVASPSLARLVGLGLTPGKLAARPAGQVRKAAVSVARYECRLRTRSTPFGLFAGVAPVRAGASAKVQWRSEPVSRTQADLDWLAGLVRRWESEPEILAHLVLRRHAGLVTRGRRLAVLAPSHVAPEQGGRPRDDVSIRCTAAVRAALDSVGDGEGEGVGVVAGDVVRDLERRFPGAPAGAALRVVRTLVEQEFLLSELRPALDGSDASAWTVEVLDRLVRRGCAAARAPLAALRRFDAARARHDATPLGERRDSMKQLAAGAAELGGNGEGAVHVDLSLGADVRLPVDVFDEAARAAGVLWRMAPPLPGASQLAAYHAEFLERYGVDRVVPLPELLDDVRGLGAPAGYTWPRHSAHRSPLAAPAAPERPAFAAPSPYGRLLSRGVAEALRDGAREVVLDDETVARLAPDPVDLQQVPESCEFYFQLLARSEAALSGGEFLLAAGPWPGPLEAGASMGRFAGLLGSLPDEAVAACLPDADTTGSHGELPLTLAYQPRLSRARNVANCPATAPYRLSLGVPPVAGEREVGLDDLAVGAEPDRLYVVHLPTGRRVRPRAHHALDAQGQAPNAARLLLDIGRFGQRFPRPWEWGPLGDLPYLPRVRYGRSVLAAARWRLDELGERATSGATEPGRDGSRGQGRDAEQEWREAVAAWRRRWSVPRHVVVGQFDRRLRLDLECRWHLDVLRDLAAKQPDLVAEEVPGGAEQEDGWLRDGTGSHHVAELVVPFRRAELVRARSAPDVPTAPAPHHALAPHGAPGAHGPVPHLAPAARGALAAHDAPVAHHAPVPHHAPHQRLSLPGEEWLYAKLHLPARAIDSFLCERLAPFLGGLADAERGAVDRWFFIRYHDGADHLRLRFHGSPNALWGRFFPRLRDAVRRWTDEGVTGRFVLDTYDPEWERYGGPCAQEAAERYFCADSEAALVLLAAARSGRPGLDTTAVAAIALASLAQGIGRLPPGGQGETGRYGGAGTVAAAWLSGMASARDVPDDFRERRADWLRLIDPGGGWPGLRRNAEGRAVLAALTDRTAALRTYVDQLGPVAADAAHAADAAAAATLHQVVPSLAHLTCNRLLGTDRDAERRALAVARACVVAHADRQRHGKKDMSEKEKRC